MPNPYCYNILYKINIDKLSIKYQYISDSHPFVSRSGLLSLTFLAMIAPWSPRSPGWARRSPWTLLIHRRQDVWSDQKREMQIQIQIQIHIQIQCIYKYKYKYSWNLKMNSPTLSPSSSWCISSTFSSFSTSLNVSSSCIRITKKIRIQIQIIWTKYITFSSVPASESLKKSNSISHYLNKVSLKISSTSTSSFTSSFISIFT